MEQLISAEFLGKPAWLWLGFLGAVGALLWLDIGFLNRKDHVIGPRESFLQAGLYIAVGLLFGAYVLWDLGAQAAVEYYTGYLVELTLALDNVFVISLILAYFAVPRELQHRVLFWGILGAIVLRVLMIGLGALRLRRLSALHRGQDAEDRAERKGGAGGPLRERPAQMAPGAPAPHPWLCWQSVLRPGAASTDGKTRRLRHPALSGAGAG